MIARYEYNNTTHSFRPPNIEMRLGGIAGPHEGGDTLEYCKGVDGK
jgi:hypothetical protein